MPTYDDYQKIGIENLDFYMSTLKDFIKVIGTSNHIHQSMALHTRFSEQDLIDIAKAALVKDIVDKLIEQKLLVFEEDRQVGGIIVSARMVAIDEEKFLAHENRKHGISLRYD